MADFTPYVIGAAAGAALAWLAFGSKVSATPTTPTACQPVNYDRLIQFTQALGYTLVRYDDKPPAQWEAPSPAAAGAKDSKLKFYSRVDCAFFAWDGSKWLADAKTNAEYANWSKAQVS